MPKYGYIESIEKAKLGDAEAKFCFAKYCSEGVDENGTKIPQDAKKAGKLLLESAEAGFGPAEYAMVGMMTRSDGSMDRIGLRPYCFQDQSGKRELGLYLGWWKYTVVSNAVAKAMPYLRRAQKHGVPLTENYFKRIDLMVRGYEQRERKESLNVELGKAAQNGDAKQVEVTKEKIAALLSEMQRDEAAQEHMDAAERKAHAEAEAKESETAAAEEARRQCLAQQEYWADWPRSVPEGGSNYVAAVKEIEERFKVALVEMSKSPKWKVGEGRSCIKYSASDGVYFEKYDADGRLVLVSNERSDFEELKAFDERREVLLKEEREVWTQTKGITYEDAMSRSNEWQNVGFSGRRPLLGGLRRLGGLGSGLAGGGSLRARRLQRQQEAAAVAARQREELAAKDAERQAQVEQEKRQREAERAEQRQQLLAIQEELKRVRGEATSASKAEGRK